MEFSGEALNRGSMDRHPYDIKRIPQPNPFNNIVERREERRATSRELDAKIFA